MEKNIYTFYRALALILGYGLIIACFIIFGGAFIETKVLVLDIIVSCMIFTQFAVFMFFPLINTKDSSHKEVGMMGLHFMASFWCITASIALMVLGIVYEIPFVYQLLGQLLILFFAVIGRITAISAGNKVKSVHKKEEITLSGRAQMRREMDNFMDDLATVKDVDASVTERLQAMQEAMRFITPSANPEACAFDQQFVDTLNNLKILMRDTTLNRDKIADEVTRLERTLTRRKKF